jgi:hypothetical protein
MKEKAQEVLAAETTTVEQLSLRIAQQIKEIAKLRRDGCDTAEALETLTGLTKEHRQRVEHCTKLLQERDSDEELTPPSKES